MSTGPTEPIYMVTDRQLRALRNTYALGEGWPFGDGPLQWFCHVEIREGTVQMVCDACPQAIFIFGQYMTERGFTWNLELLKSRVADHVLKCHPEAAI